MRWKKVVLANRPIAPQEIPPKISDASLGDFFILEKKNINQCSSFLKFFYIYIKIHSKSNEHWRRRFLIIRRPAELGIPLLPQVSTIILSLFRGHFLINFPEISKNHTFKISKSSFHKLTLPISYFLPKKIIG